MASLPVAGQWLAAFFQSASARTAGFNSVDLAQFTQPALLVMIVLMLIGAGSTSTGGGIKVSTLQWHLWQHGRSCARKACSDL